MLGDLDLLEPERAHGLLEQDHAGDDRGRAVGVEADDLPALLFVHVGKPREQQFDGAQLEHIAVYAGGVVGVELLVDRGGGRRGAGDGDAVVDRRALLSGEPGEQRVGGVLGERLQLLGTRRIRVDVALAHAHDAGVQRHVEACAAFDADDELGGAAADIDDDGRRRRRVSRVARTWRRGT